MEIVEINHIAYKNMISLPYHIFASTEFNNINEDKASSVHYLLFKDSKYRLGIIGGIRDNVFFSPFSAPFGGFIFLQEDVKISYIDDSILLLSEWAKTKGLSELKITLPPAIYQESFISKQINSLYRNGFTIEKADLNYAYNLQQFNEDYAASIWYNARKNLKIALGNGFSLKTCATQDEKENAYQVIKQNRAARGFPLRMTWEQVKASAAVMQADFFLVENTAAIAVAAAIVFHVAKGIVQVVYWGDLPEYANQKTMNFLSFKIFEYYHKFGMHVIDIGPSTENSIPNFGLCEFKESIGCDISMKFSFIKHLK